MLHLSVKNKITINILFTTNPIFQSLKSKGEVHPFLAPGIVRRAPKGYTSPLEFEGLNKFVYSKNLEKFWLFSASTNKQEHVHKADVLLLGCSI